MNADEYEYPPSWAPPGVEPPRRRDYTPPLRSALGYTSDEQPEPQPDDYPQSWRQPTRPSADGGEE